MAGLKNNYQFEFTDTLTTSGTSVRISNEKENGAGATFTNQYITVRSEDNSIVERMKGSAAAGVLTLTMRGLDQSDTDTEVVGLKREWREGSKAFVTYVASQHVDPRDDNTFSGTQTFNNVVVSQDVTIGDDLTVSGDTTLNGKYKGPVVDDVTARDTLYPAPVDGNIVQVKSLNSIQFYQTSLGGRQTLGVGTPPADASEIVKGIVELATNAEAIAGTNDTTAMPPLKVKNTMDNVSTVLYDTTTEITGESLAPGDNFFKESGITFAGATSSQRIGEISNLNSRVEGVIIGSGVSGTTQKLSLSKTGTPTQALGIRIETDSAGTPSGTLADPNSTTTVAQASLTTSLADTTITFPGAFTLTKGVKYHVVLYQGTYGSETVSASNYYNVGYSTNNTPLRGSKTYDNAPTANDLSGFTYTTSTSSTVQNGFRVTANLNTNIVSVTKDAATNATRCQLLTDAGALQGSATFIGNVATFSSPLPITSGVTYRVLLDNSGASYSWRNTVTAVVYPVAGTALNYISGYQTGSGVIAGSAYQITSIQTAGNGWSVYNPAIQLYTSSALIEDILLMKTDATYTYKLPTDFPRISRQTVAMGSTVMFDFGGISKQFTGLSNTTYYLTNTPGLIGTSAGTNAYIVGQGNTSTNLEIEGRNLNKAITVTASPFSYVNTTGGPIQVKITGGTVNPIVINGVTTATATGHINTLPAGATMTVTYTVLPTIVYSDL